MDGYDDSQQQDSVRAKEKDGESNAGFQRNERSSGKNKMKFTTEGLCPADTSITH